MCLHRRGEYSYRSQAGVKNGILNYRLHPSADIILLKAEQKKKWISGSETEKCKAMITERFKTLLKLRRTLRLAPVGPAFPPKNLLSVSSVFFAAGDRGRAELTQGLHAGWPGYLCPSTPLLPNRLGRLFSSFARSLGSCPTGPRPRAAPAADPPRPAAGGDGGSRRESGGAERRCPPRPGGWGTSAHTPPISVSAAERSTEGEEKPVWGLKGKRN